MLPAGGTVEVAVWFGHSRNRSPDGSIRGKLAQPPAASAARASAAAKVAQRPLRNAFGE
jgi:hypothetical protein